MSKLVPLLVLTAAACAAAAPPDSAEEHLLQPYGVWFNQQNSRFGMCCSLGDGRIVNWHITGDHYEVRFLHPETIAGERPRADVYYPVLSEAVLRVKNPTGFAIAWWSATPISHTAVDGTTLSTNIRCFAPDSEF